MAEKQPKKPRSHQVCSVLVVLAVTCVICMGAVFDVAGKEITVTEINEFNNENKSVVIKTRQDDVQAFLTENGLVIGEHDKLSHLEESLLVDDDQIVIKRGKPVTISADGTQVTLSTTKATVGEALTEAGYLLEENDVVAPDVNADVAEYMTIEITRVLQEVPVIAEAIPREVTYVEDNNLLKGETKVMEEGKDGVVHVTQNVVYHDGEEISREEVQRTVVEEPQDKVIARGTATPKPTAKPTPAPTEKVKAAIAPKKEARGSASNTSGALEGKKKLTMTATAYSAFDGSGRTASGMKARYGVVAVDPKVIPLGTKVYVEGYGYAIAADTGGAIKGNKIDLCFEDTNSNLRKFGRKTVEVYILD